MVNGVDSKSIDYMIQPKPEHIQHCRNHFRVAPVQVGLRGQEGMIIILP